MVSFYKKKVGNQFPCFICFEAGATHSGIESAKRLVRLAAEAGADAVKFQISNPDRLISDKNKLFSYEILEDRQTLQTKTIEEPLYNILRRRYLSNEEWVEVKKYCDQFDLLFFATIIFEDQIELLQKINCDSIKICSVDINHWPLIRLAAKTKKCIQIDTGNASIGEIEEAVDIIRTEGNENIIIHHCPSGYPARLDSINLNIIQTLKKLFPYPIAFSDHSPGWDMDIAAVSLGVNLIEKTITEDRTTLSPEHMFSLEPDDMKSFISKVREIEKALGKSRRILYPEEINKRTEIRRSTFLKKTVHKGEKLSTAEVEFRSPGFGLSPKYYEIYADKAFLNDLPEGHMLSIKDIG